MFAQYVDAFGYRQYAGIDPAFGHLRRFVRVRNARKLWDLANPRAGVNVVRVALLADREAWVKKDFVEALSDRSADMCTVERERRNEGRDDDDAAPGQKRRHLTDATNMFAAVLTREPEIGTEADPEIFRV